MKHVIVSIMICILLSGCAQNTPSESNTPVTFTDALEHAISVEAPERVVVSPASFAEVWQLAGGEVLASTEDSFESGLLTKDTATSIGLVQSPDVEQILAQAPDFVILSETTPGHAELYETLHQSGINTAYFSVETFDEYLDMLKVCTDITGRQDLYDTNGTAVKERIDAAITKKEGHTPPTVLFIRSYSSGAKVKNSNSMTGKMLQDMGCINIADQEESLLEELSMEVIIREDPDFIFVTTMGVSDEKAIQTLKDGIQKNPAWAELSAVKNGRYHVLPKDLFHLKPNNRWGESYEMLAKLLYETE